MRKVDRFANHYFLLRQLLIYEPGRNVRMRIERGGRQFDVKLVLDED